MLTQNRWDAAPDHADACDILWRLLSSATRLINEHTSAGGQCASCGNAWPCDIACRAEFFLGGI